MTDSERKWALEAESKPKYLWFKPLTPIGPNTLFEWVQSVYFY